MSNINLPTGGKRYSGSTLVENLGHATAAFTLDIYGHVTDQMKHASAERMEAFIHAVSC